MECTVISFFYRSVVTCRPNMYGGGGDVHRVFGPCHFQDIQTQAVNKNDMIFADIKNGGLGLPTQTKHQKLCADIETKILHKPPAGREWKIAHNA